MIELILGVSGSVISLLLMIVGYFIKRLLSSVDSLEATAQSLVIIAGVDKERHKHIDNKLENHEERIVCLEKK